MITRQGVHVKIGGMPEESILDLAMKGNSKEAKTIRRLVEKYGRERIEYAVKSWNFEGLKLDE